MSTVINQQKSKNQSEYTSCDCCGGNKTNLFLEAESEVNKEKFKMSICEICVINMKGGT